MGVKPHTHKIMMPLAGPMIGTVRSVQIVPQWFVVFILWLVCGLSLIIVVYWMKMTLLKTN